MRPKEAGEGETWGGDPSPLGRLGGGVGTGNQKPGAAAGFLLRCRSWSKAWSKAEK